MSHVATLNTLVKDFSLVAQIAEAKGWSFDSVMAKRMIYVTSKVGAALKPTGWAYPIVISEEGSLHYDHYNGQWGNPELLQEFTHEYTTQLNLQDLQMAGMSAYVAETQRNSEGQVVTRILIS